MQYVVAGTLFFVCILIGYVVRGAVDKPTVVDKSAVNELRSIAMGYGYEEKSQLWHRIRVNDKGHVVCSKE